MASGRRSQRSAVCRSAHRTRAAVLRRFSSRGRYELRRAFRRSFCLYDPDYSTQSYICVGTTRPFVLSPGVIPPAGPSIPAPAWGK